MNTAQVIEISAEMRKGQSSIERNSLLGMAPNLLRKLGLWHDRVMNHFSFGKRDTRIGYLEQVSLFSDEDRFVWVI